MRKKILLFSLLLVTGINVYCQGQDAKQLQESAKAFMRQGDYANANLVLIRALQQDPNNIQVIKDLAFNYYLQKDNAKALETIKPLIDGDNSDDQSFQIAGNIYKAMDQYKECEKMYKKGIKKFPNSGALYSEYGELLASMQDANAIKQWEKGIEMDPGFHGNYYNASRYYSLTGEKIWSIIYAEIFLNIETSSGRTAEIKNLLLDSYKRLFADIDITKNSKDKNPFEQAFLQTMNKQSSVASKGINPESLTMIRTRFILDWYNSYASKFPFRLFDYQHQLLQQGLFDAYNQWIFGAAQNLVTFQNWTSLHSPEYNEFSTFQKGRVFRVPAAQYYH
jgi:tetratricopeptide (TPR) repeat protein